MPLFNARLDYALRALVDIALCSPREAVQARDIALRQGIREPYLDQILGALKRGGIVRSVRGAGGGYLLVEPPRSITVAQVVHAMVGDGLLAAPGAEEHGASRPAAGAVVHQLARRLEADLGKALAAVTVADLAQQAQQLDESLSIMPGI
ncbi:MAG TPA: Rrf2 family transcriptional regulator [Chthonomonadales bacterium]|nr:Rrf2 family transcriptional regulator [Chthonomonadales bacterium]